MLDAGVTKEFVYKTKEMDKDESFAFLEENTADENAGLWFDLTLKTYRWRSFSEILNDGWRITKQKIQTDLEPTKE